MVSAWDGGQAEIGTESASNKPPSPQMKSAAPITNKTDTLFFMCHYCIVSNNSKHIYVL